MPAYATPAQHLLAFRGGGLRLLIRIVFVHFLFHTLGFPGAIAILVVVIAGIWLYRRRSGRGGGRRPWR